MFGNYYYVLPSNILTSAIKAGGACTELALASYKRFIVAREPDSHSSLNSGMVKEITGGARVIYSTDTDVNLHCTLILECNDKPKLSETNRSIQRRLVDVKFKQTFVTKAEYDEAIEGLNEDEIEELRLGIQNNQFKEASFRSKTITEDYMKDSDVLLQWVNDNYEKTDNIKDNVKLKDVFIEKTIYDDKMIPKYSNEIYEIIKVNKNNVTVFDNGKNKIIKNDNLKIVNNIENPILKAQKTANIQHKNKLRLLRENI